MKSLFIGFLLAASISADPVSLSQNQNFCPGGSPHQIPVPTWGTYCDKGDATLGHAATGTFRLDGPFDIYLSGDPGGPNLNLELENLTDRQVRDIRPNVGPGPFWDRVTFDLPAGWRGKDLRLVATDQSTSSMGWIAFSAPLPPVKGEPRREAVRLLLKTLLFTFLLFLPGFTISSLAISLGVRGTLKLGLLTLAGVALPGYLLFFGYVLSPNLAFQVSRYVPWACIVVLLFFLIRLTPPKLRLLLPLLLPLALTFFAALGNLAWGYLYGGTDTPNMTAWNRFSHPLPPDNMLPYLFAEGVRKGGVPKPMQADWLSSDRPPLQTGMVLALEPWMKSDTRHELWYHVVSVLAQSLWVFAIWLLLRAFRISPLTTAAVILTIYLSGFTIVNTFYVWPKLLAAAFLIAFAIPTLAWQPSGAWSTQTRNRQASAQALPAGHPGVARRQAAPRRWLLRILMAFLLACSMLSHGGTVFALLGLMLWMAIRYRRPMLREGCFVAAIFLLFYSPWMAYQKLVDPPGDRLIKYHLAGVESITREPALKTIVQAYEKLTLSEWLDAKRENTGTAFGHERDFLVRAPAFLDAHAEADLRAFQFFFFLPALGFTGLGVFCLLLRRTKKRVRREMSAAERLWLWAILTTIPWILMLFIRSMTIVHASAYAMELAAMTGSILALRSILPRFALSLCAVQCIFNWIVYTPDLTHLAFPNSLNQTTNHWMLALHLLSLWSLLGVLAFTIGTSASHKIAITKI